MSTNHPSSRFYTVILIALTVLVGLQSAAMTSAGAAGPVIATVSSPVLAGSSFNIVGSGFSAGARVNFFVSTAAGSINQGPLKPAAFASTSLRVNVSALTPLGQGVVAVQVINTDQGFAASNIVDVLLEGAASAGIPSLTAINGVGLAVSSTNPRYAVDNVETVVPRGSKVTLQGTGFDTTHGVAVDVFCAAAGGKVGPFYINPGNPGLSPTSITLMLPATGPFALPVGPASFVISNKGSDGRYAKKSNAVSVPIGRRIQVISVMQKGNTLIVDGTGLSTLTVINFYQTQKSGAVNLGGLLSGGVRAIPITLVSDTELRFGVPARAVPGPAYVQAINPPFVPFESSGNDPGGAFILAGPTPAPIPTATVRPTPTPTPTPTPISGLHPTATPGRATPTAKATGLPTATPTPQPAEAYGALLTGGMDNTLTASGSHPTLASAETYDEAKGVFTSTGPMGYPRTGHSVTVLSNGTILVAGGHNAFSMRAMPSAELYDIKTRSFSFTGGMNSARLAHAAVLLKNGQVLIAGGQNVDFSAMDLAEIYDPATGLFSPTASMRNPRVAPAAAMLNDGSVLIAGGADNNGLLASAELYDSGGAASVPVGSLTTVRQGATATLLPNGSVLIAGGASQTTTCTGCATATAEIFNPLTRTFTRTGNMHAARRGHSATPLPGGTVLIAGGLDDAGGAAATSAEIYNPATGAFTVTGTMNVARFEHVAGALASGKVLIAGGFNGPNTITNTAEIYDPATGKFAPVPGMTDSRADQGMGCFSLGGSASWDRRGAAHPAGKSN